MSLKYFSFWCHILLRKLDFGGMLVLLAAKVSASYSGDPFSFLLPLQIDVKILRLWHCFCFGPLLPSKNTESIRVIWSIPDFFITIFSSSHLHHQTLHIPPKPNPYSPEIGHTPPPGQQSWLASLLGATLASTQRAGPASSGSRMWEHPLWFLQMGLGRWWGRGLCLHREKIRRRYKLTWSAHRFSAGWFGWFIVVYRALLPLSWLVPLLARGQPVGL